MNRTIKALAATALAFGLAFAGTPVLGLGGGGMTVMTGGGTGCCKQ